MSKPRRMREHRSWAWLTGVALVKPVLFAFSRHTWIDGEKLPAEGGCVVVANHVSHIDPLTLAHFMHDHGRLPRYLAKDALFDVFFVGSIMRGTGQIPVARLTSDAADAYSHAVEGVLSRKAVVFYPEGTLTRDPELWPMVGRTGAARVALETRAPVVPVAQWGQHEILYPYARRPHLVPRHEVRVKAGDPVDLLDLYDRPITPQLLAEATDRIMTTLTTLVAELRGEPVPRRRFDPKAHGIKQIGNPHAADPGDARKAQ